jgi:serine-type anaerobic sulfatase-maturating enzyme
LHLTIIGEQFMTLPFHIMTKPGGPSCNINCKYCYYLDKGKFYPEARKFQMSDDVLDRFIRDYITSQLAAGLSEVTFVWQGGEPTILGLDYYRQIIALQEKYRPTGVKISNSLQTNATLLDEEWAIFLKENDFLVGISLDGPKAIHDRYRVDRAERPTFDAVMRGLELLQRHEVEHNALTVVNRHSAMKAKEIYTFLRGAGIEYIQFIPIVERSVKDNGLSAAPQLDEEDCDSIVTSWSVRPLAYGKFLSDVFDIWIKRDVGKVFVQLFDAQLGLWLGQPSSVCCYGEQCGQALALEHNGDLYACDHYVYPEYKLGNIMETNMTEMASSPFQREFGHDKTAGLPQQCIKCPYRFACNGGCPKQRFDTAKNGEKGLNYLCPGYLRFFEHAGPKIGEMAKLLRSGRPADAIMQI